MISIGIMAYNEQDNIGLLLGWLTKNYKQSEIIVVASGCTDDTVEICNAFPIFTYVQQEREGKASAINLFLHEARGESLVLISADTIPDVMCIERLVENLVDDVGMTGCRVKSVAGIHASRIMWDICHYLSLRKPKLGEIICFRNVVGRIEDSSSVDEAAIDSEISARGYSKKYLPDAVIWQNTK